MRREPAKEPPSNPMDRLEKTRWLVAAALERKAEDVVALDVQGVSSFADTFVIATGRSDRQVRAIAEAIQQAAAAHGVKPLGIEGLAEGRWVLIDLDDVIVHVFHPEARQFYALERLWSDAEPIALDEAVQTRSAP